MHFLLDANVPRSLREAIAASGHACTDVRDTPLAGAADAEIAALARDSTFVLVTRDFDFADVRAYPPEQYAGIVVLSTHETATAATIKSLFAAFLAQAETIAALPGRLAIVEFGRIRLRPPT